MAAKGKTSRLAALAPLLLLLAAVAASLTTSALTCGASETRAWEKSSAPLESRHPESPQLLDLHRPKAPADYYDASGSPLAAEKPTVTETPAKETPAAKPKLPEKVQGQIEKAGLPKEGDTPFEPKLVKNKKGDLVIDKAEIKYGPKQSKIGFVDKDGNIWIKDRAHAGAPDHWDVQVDGGKSYFRIGLDGKPL